ncbi:MAG: type I DNA topoisomerase [Candidatus Nanoperiomorbaceae bacterium]
MSKDIKNLVVVESPAKAHTIGGFLGPNYTVMASVGHIRSIAKDTRDKKAIDTAHDFATVYQVDPDKTKTVRELKAAAKKTLAGGGKIFLASDEDREGEAIAWHLAQVFNLPTTDKNRITYTEITKSAVENALKQPRTIDMNLVKAQQARQILDRLVGFELSPVVWRKVPGGKSAGRVQSPAVKLLVEREREIAKFQNSSSFKTIGVFTKNDSEIKATLNHDFTDETAAKQFLESLNNARYSVADVEQKDAKRNPLPPFTTSTLQQDANARLGYSARSTMSIAQHLYQAGFITYMRTDSLNLSNQFLGAAGRFITQQFGEKYLKIRTFHTKAAGAQEAHEAIRPTDPAREIVGSGQDQKLYDLIRRRTLASQMASAELSRTTATIDISDHDEKFVAKGEVVLFPGFLKMYGAAKDELLPELNVGELLNATEISARQTFAKPPARYSEGSLVKKLEDLEIGRPSTYATIISTIQNRGYAERGEGEGEERAVIVLTRRDDKIQREIVTEKTGSTKGKLVPTPSGSVLTDFLNDYFTDIDDYKFTAKVENELDEIADKKLDKTAMLRNFYDPFHAKIEDSDTIERSTVAGMKLVGTDPKGRKIYARIGRFGPMLQIGGVDANGQPDKTSTATFANFPKGFNMENITVTAAEKMFALPRVVGQLPDDFADKLDNELGTDKFAKIKTLLDSFNGGESAEIFANIGRFGPYVALRKAGNKTGGLFVSLGQTSPFDVTFEDALNKIHDKLIAEANKIIVDFGEVKILNGRFGPYVTDGNKNAKLPKEIRDDSTKVAKITETEARKLLAEAPTGRDRFGRRGHAATKLRAATKAKTTTLRRPKARRPRTKK